MQESQKDNLTVGNFLKVFQVNYLNVLQNLIHAIMKHGDI